LAHRDIKPDNIVMSESGSGAILVDLASRGRSPAPAKIA